MIGTDLVYLEWLGRHIEVGADERSTPGDDPTPDSVPFHEINGGFHPVGFHFRVSRIQAPS